MKRPLFALTLWPEWAWAIAHLDKGCENRTWTPDKGTLLPGDWLAIHAGAHIGGRPGSVALGEGLQRVVQAAGECGWTCEQTAERQWVLTKPSFNPVVLDAPHIATRALVALVRHQRIEVGGDGPWVHVDAFQWRWSEHVRLDEPILCRGMQGLWQVCGPPLLTARASLARALAARKAA
jgi:hypothetical protein